MTARHIAHGLLLAALVLGCPQAGAGKLTIERLFAAPDLSGASLRAPQISPDGSRVTYLRGKPENKDRLDLWAYDLATRRHVLLVDSALLAPGERAPSAEEAQRRERQRTSSLSGILEYQFSRDSRHLLIPLDGELYVYDLRAPPERAVRRLTDTASAETDARFSPRGRYVSFVRDRNLFVHDLETGAERAITREGGGAVSFGVAEFIAQEEMGRETGYWWSPDDRHIAFTRTDESAVAEVERFEIFAANVAVVKQRYPAAGERNARVQLFVAEVAAPRPGSRAVEVDLGSDPDFYLARVDWFPDGEALAVQRQSRDQQTLALLRAERGSGRTRELLREHSDFWVDLHDELTFLERSPHFIWASQRTGFNHLYLYELDGTLVRPLTSGEWMVTPEGSERAVRGIDERRGLVYFTANAASPLERHLYVASLRDPAAPVRRVTQQTGWHAVEMSRDARLFLDTFSTPEQPPSVTLRDVRDEPIAALAPNRLAADHPYAPYRSEHLPTEFGTLRARDGQTLHYQMIRPRESAPGQRHPVIVDVYGGPGYQRVRRAWGGYPRSNEGFFRQYLAQQGYVVFTLDNRGSGFRGVRFETALHHRMGSVEVEDQVTGVEFLRTLPYVDPERIGIFGWSYGGYLALMCAMQAPDHFAAAAAGAPVTDWRLYDTHYTERYLGTPQRNPQVYSAANVLDHARGLRGALLVMHGMADDNVLFSHSTALFERLQDLNKPFDIMAYPGSKHGLLRHADTGPHAYGTVVRFFDRTLRRPLRGT